MESHKAVTITKDELAQMPLVQFKGTITVVETEADAEAAVEDLLRHNVLGFDTETKPTFKKGKPNNVALMQVSYESHTYLFRINKLGFTPAIRRFIEADTIVKVGLSLKDDFFVMHRNHDFSPAGFIDLQDFVKNYGIADASLQKIFAALFAQRISKSQRLSNWEAPSLTIGQQHYASIDAWACLKIYNHLTSGQFVPEQSPFYREIPEQNQNN